MTETMTDFQRLRILNLISELTCIIMASIHGNPVLASLQALSNSSSSFHGIYIIEFQVKYHNI